MGTCASKHTSKRRANSPADSDSEDDPSPAGKVSCTPLAHRDIDIPPHPTPAVGAAELGVRSPQSAARPLRDSAATPGRAAASYSQLCSSYSSRMTPLSDYSCYTSACSGGGQFQSANLRPRPIGFRTGGAQDAGTFRTRVAARLLPAPSDVTYEGVAKDYFFNMSPEGAEEAEEATERCTDLFFPTYSLALAPDPLLGDAGGAPDLFLSVGLDSGVTDFRRPRLNLMLLLDISGSMAAGFDGTCVYDRQDAMGQTKLDAAKAAIQGMMDRLGEDDALGICLFESHASTLAPMGGAAAPRLAALREEVGALSTRGCTDLQAGIDLATAEVKRYGGYRAAVAAATETRIVVITDAMPNSGDFSGDGLTARIKANALDGIHTTVVGVGVDFNTELIEEIGKARGANYLSVHSPAEARTRLCDDFDCLVSPLVYDLALALDPASLAAGWRILHAYGSPNPQDSALSEDGTVMKIHTLFPSPKTEEGVKGGVVLLRMRAPPAGAAAPAPLALTATYRDRDLAPLSSRKNVRLPAWVGAGAPAGPAPAVFESSGVRKAVALARYVDALQSWLVDERAPAAAADEPRPDLPTHYLVAFGAEGDVPQQLWLAVRQRLVPPARAALDAASCPPGSRSGRASRLRAGPRAREALAALAGFMAAEAAAVGDTGLTKEADLLRSILAAPEAAEGGARPAP